MTDLSNLPVEEKIRKAAHSLEPRSEFSEALWSQIAEKPRSVSLGFSFKQFFARPVWAVAATLAVIALVVTAARSQNVVTAFNSLLVYLPGIGFIQNDDSTLYLAQPITVEQEGFVLTVDQAISDTEKTVIAYHIDGLPAGSDCLYDINELRFPTGDPRPPFGGEVHDSQARLEFPTLPSGVKEATLLVGLSEASAACKAPASWEVNIPFGSVPPDAPLLPVVESTVSQPLSAPAAADAPETQENPDGIRFTFERVVELSDGYLVTGKVQWTNKAWKNATVFPENIQVTDAGGAEIPVAPTEEGHSDNSFAFKIAGKTSQGPLTIKFQAIQVWEVKNEAGSFSFDAGANPQLGQIWPMENELEVEGYKINIHTIRAIYVDPDVDGTEAANGNTVANDPTVANGYAIDLTIDPGTQNAYWFCHGKEETSSFGQSQSKDSEKTEMTIDMVYYPEGLPTGQLTCEMTNLNFIRNGPWQAQLQIP